VNWAHDRTRANRPSTFDAESLLRGIGRSAVIDNSSSRQLRQLLGALRHVGSEHKREGSQRMGRGTSRVRAALRAPASADAAGAALPIEVSSATRRAAGKATTGRLFRRSTASRQEAGANLINTQGRVE